MAKAAARMDGSRTLQAALRTEFGRKATNLLREAERGPLAFSVAKTALGPLTGAPCNLGNGEARVVSRELGLRWSPK